MTWGRTYLWIAILIFAAASVVAHLVEKLADATFASAAQA
jgi:hypothetical protein